MVSDGCGGKKSHYLLNLQFWFLSRGAWGNKGYGKTARIQNAYLPSVRFVSRMMSGSRIVLEKLLVPLLAKKLFTFCVI
jgi:hypothetical protein